jgi:hypothetical protein
MRGLMPSLAGPIKVPLARHPHVGMKRQAALEAHHQVLTSRLDRQQLSALEPTNDVRARFSYGFARQPFPQRHGSAPDRVAFRH